MSDMADNCTNRSLPLPPDPEGPRARVLPEPSRISPLAYVHEFSERRRDADDESDPLAD